MKWFEVGSSWTMHLRTLLQKNTWHKVFHGVQDPQGPGRVKVTVGMRERRCKFTKVEARA